MSFFFFYLNQRASLSWYKEDASINPRNNPQCIKKNCYSVYIGKQINLWSFIFKHLNNLLISASKYSSLSSLWSLQEIKPRLWPFIPGSKLFSFYSTKDSFQYFTMKRRTVTISYCTWDLSPCSWPWSHFVGPQDVNYWSRLVFVL